MSYIINLDHQLTAFIYSLPHSIYSDAFFIFMSAVGTYGLIWIVIAGALMIFEEWRNKKFIVPFIVAIVLTSIVTNIILKPVFNRQRPLTDHGYQTDPAKILNTYPTDPSFPSGHASVSFAAAAVLAYFDKKRRCAFYIVAFLIAFSRIWLARHYVGDVIAGALLGYIIARCTLKYYI